MKSRLIERKAYVDRVHKALDRSAVVALMGPRQCGKTTLARMIFEEAPDRQAGAYFDLESQVDFRRLARRARIGWDGQGDDRQFIRSVQPGGDQQFHPDGLPEDSQAHRGLAGREQRHLGYPRP